MNEFDLQVRIDQQRETIGQLQEQIEELQEEVARLTPKRGLAADFRRRWMEAEAKLRAVGEKGLWLVGEVRECWDKGRISIDAKTAADELEALLK